VIDWAQVRKTRFSSERPDEWPEGVFAVSLNGVTLLGIHEKTGKLFWDGKEVITRHRIRLGTFERWVAVIATAGTFGSFLVNFGRALEWWN
jgi:hypothetical protein